MGPRLIRKYCVLSAECERIMENAVTKLGFSARGYDRILKRIRTSGCAVGLSTMSSLGGVADSGGYTATNSLMGFSFGGISVAAGLARCARGVVTSSRTNFVVSRPAVSKNLGLFR